MTAKALTALLKAFEETLTGEIRNAVCTYKIDNPAYCLALNYGDPCGSCIPVLGLGLSNGDTVPPIPSGKIDPKAEWLWNPAEFSSFGDPALQPRSSELSRLDRQLRMACINGVEIDLRALCNRLAVRLNKLTWRQIPTSVNFLVYAADDDLVDLSANLMEVRASVVG